MRVSVFALFLLTTAVALGQAAPPAKPSPVARLSREFKFNNPPQLSALSPQQTLLAQNEPPALPLDAGPAYAKPQPIPTQWPNAKFELIPTQWPNARVVLVGGPAHVVLTGGATATPQSGATVAVQLQQKPQK